jgi:hypothetical protein
VILWYIIIRRLDTDFRKKLLEIIRSANLEWLFQELIFVLFIRTLNNTIFRFSNLRRGLSCVKGDGSMGRILYTGRFIFCFVFLCLFLVTSTVNIAAIESDNLSDSPIMVPIVNIISQSYDVKGYADSPGGVSTLESTVAALSLIAETIPEQKSVFSYQFDTIAEYILSYQDTSGGFRRSLDDFRPDMKTTALSTKALVLMERLDEKTENLVENYLKNFFYGGLEFDDWLTDGHELHGHLRDRLLNSCLLLRE